MKTKQLSVGLFILAFVPIACAIYVWLGMSEITLKDFPGEEDAAWGSSIGWLVLFSLVGWTTLPKKKSESKFTPEEEDLLRVLSWWNRTYSVRSSDPRAYGTSYSNKLLQTQTWAMDAEKIATNLRIILPTQFLKKIEPIAKKQSAGSTLHVVRDDADESNVA